MRSYGVTYVEEDCLLYSETRLLYFEALAKELVDGFRPSTALDVGCGSAQLVFILHRLGVKAWGVDMAESYLSKAPEQIKDYLACVDIDSQKLPFPNEFFDLVISHHSIEHFQSPQLFILEAQRVLKPKGIVMILTPNPLFEKGRSLLRFLRIERTPKSAHPNTHSLSFWVKKFENGGFRKIGDLKPFVRRGCIDLDPPIWLWGQILLKFGFLGKKVWQELAPYVRGTALFEKAS